MDERSLEALGLSWYPNGQAALRGPLLDLHRRLDALFVTWAQDVSAELRMFPPFIPAGELNKLDYFRSFPHLATFPVSLDPDADNLREFAAAGPMKDEAIQLRKCAPIKDVLTPAACYHVYIGEQGKRLEGPRYFTTLATCFRRETHYVPLERQWSFGLREIVCLGNADEVQDFLKRYRERTTRFLEKIGLPVEWIQATDPFFDPQKQPKHLAQRLSPMKWECEFQGRLAIASVNYHRTYFGEAFQISRGDEPTCSGCIGFGLERWLSAFVAHFGTNPAAWNTEG